MGNRATVRRVLASLLVASAGLGSPLVTFAETHTQTIQVVIRIPERRPKLGSLIQMAQASADVDASTARDRAIASAIAAHTLASASATPDVSIK